MATKFTYEKVKEEFSKKNYILLSTEYTGCFEKLNVICPNGHDHSVSFNNFYNHGTICPTCSKKKKPSFEEVFAFFKKEGYSLLTKNYVNCDQKLKTLCPNEHPYEVDYYHFLN